MSSSIRRSSTCSRTATGCCTPGSRWPRARSTRATKGNAPFDTKEVYVIDVTTGHISRTIELGPVADPAATLVTAARRAGEIRVPMHEKVTDVWRRLVEES